METRTQLKSVIFTTDIFAVYWSTQDVIDGPNCILPSSYFGILNGVVLQILATYVEAVIKSF